MFFSQMVSAPRTQFEEKELQFFVELLYGGVCGAEFVEQSQTPPKILLLYKGTHNADSIIESKVIYYLEQCRLRV